MTFQEAPFEIERLGLTPSQAMILSVLGSLGPCQSSMIHCAIEDKLGLKRSRRSVTVIVGCLVDRGFIRMLPNKTGRHEWPTYTLTDKAGKWREGV